MRIVIARTDAIGDTLLTAPLAEAIKFKYPQAEILFIVSSKGLPVVENNPFIDQIHLYDPRTKWASFRALYDKLKSFHADYFFYVGGDHMCSFAAFLARIPCRGGILSRWPSFLFLNRGLRQHRCQSDKHEVFYNLDLLFPLKITGDDSKKNLFVGMYLEPEKEKNAVDEFKKQLSSLGLPAQREWIFVHPGMAGHTLNWPSHFYGQLIRELEKKIP
jgi:ADP-heptose:LPS heptosyltransferase